MRVIAFSKTKYVLLIVGAILLLVLGGCRQTAPMPLPDTSTPSIADTITTSVTEVSTETTISALVTTATTMSTIPTSTTATDIPITTTGAVHAVITQTKTTTENEFTTIKPTTKRKTTSFVATKNPTTIKPTTKRKTTSFVATKNPTTIKTTTKCKTTITKKNPATIKSTVKRTTTFSAVTKKTTTVRPTTNATTTQSTTERKPTTTFRIDPDTGLYEADFPAISFHYESTDYTMFYELINQYCGETITDEFDVRCIKSGQQYDPVTKEYIWTAFDLYFYTKINGCRSTESFSFSFRLDGDTFLCNRVWFDKPPYDSGKVKPPRKPTAEEEAMALESEKTRTLEKLEKWHPDLTFVVTKQEVEYHYNIEQDKNYFVVNTYYTDLEDEGWGAKERTKFEIER